MSTVTDQFTKCSEDNSLYLLGTACERVTLRVTPAGKPMVYFMLNFLCKTMNYSLLNAMFTVLLKITRVIMRFLMLTS